MTEATDLGRLQLMVTWQTDTSAMHHWIAAVWGRVLEAVAR